MHDTLLTPIALPASGRASTERLSRLRTSVQGSLTPGESRYAREDAPVELSDCAQSRSIIPGLPTQWEAGKPLNSLSQQRVLRCFHELWRSLSVPTVPPRAPLCGILSGSDPFLGPVTVSPWKFYSL